MTYDFDEDNSWMDALVTEVPVKAAKTKTVKSQTGKKYQMSDWVGAKISAGHQGKTISSDTRAKIGASLKSRKRSPQHQARLNAINSQAKKGNTYTCKPIMTPSGVFHSKKSAIEYATKHCLKGASRKIAIWLKTHPELFYYVPKVTK
jgi:hypothetical protein